MKKEDKWNGICISGAFIFILGFLYLNPDYLGNRVVNGMISTLSGIIGIVGLTVELSKLMKKLSLIHIYHHRQPRGYRYHHLYL